MDVHNFAAVLAGKSQASQLVDAKTGEVFTDIPGRIARNAGLFLSYGLKPGDSVVIVCRQTPCSALAYLGAIYAGLVAVPIDGASLAEIPSYIQISGARGLWAEVDVVLPQPPSHVVVIDGRKEPSALLGGPPAPRYAHDLAALMATSGTTGTPRFVKVSHGNLLSNTQAIVRSQRLAAGESAMLVLPLSYCFGASVLHSHLFCGGTVVFDGRFMFPDKVLRAMADYGCTTFAGVPSVYKILLSRSSLKSMVLPGLHRVIQAGGHLEWRYIEELIGCLPQVSFYVMYGQTEATARISCLEPEKIWEKRGSVGRPLDNLRVRIVNESGEVLPPDQNGLIEVSGPSICLGYWEAPEATADRFVDGWLRTNDLGRLDQDGYLWIEGRNADFLKVRGKRLAFGEVEQWVLGITGVRDVAVCSIPHEEAGEAPAIFIVPVAGGCGEEVAERVKRSLPPLWTCDMVVALEQLPLTDRGKLNRAALAALLKKP